MPAPITFDTMMAAASSGPSRRASDAVRIGHDRGGRLHRVMSRRSIGRWPMRTHCWAAYFAKRSTFASTNWEFSISARGSVPV